jgi:Pyruvate/2-oxoacid:ferredoxin oxidoreductase delta subunit
LKGANVVVIPCNARHNFKAFELAKKTLEAFGFNCIKISKFSDLEQIKAENPGKIIEKMDGRNKREQWLHIVKHLMKHPLKNSRVKTDWFGMIEVDGRCTLCMTCTSFCPSNAIRNENALKFNHALCIACNLCKACPENAIKLKKILDFEQIGEREIYRDELLRCPSCGKQHISKAMYEKLSEIGKHSILFCSDCRPKIILETIYDEMMNERKKGEDYG